VRVIETKTNREQFRFELPNGFSLETAIVLGEAYLYKNEWKFNPIASGFNGGLRALCESYVCK
jgi:stress response protein SCP2